MTTARYLALDTGDRNGWATFSSNGTFLRRGVLPEDSFLQMLSEGWQGVQVVICERFVQFPGMGHRLVLNSFTVAQMVGAVKLACYQRGWELHMQQPQQMRTAIQWLGYTYSPKSHVPDQIAAHGHGVFYLSEKLKILDLMQARRDKENYESRDKSKASS